MPTYNKLNKEINNNEIYSTTELEEDKKKLGKSVNKFKTKELNAIREQLKDSLRDFSKAELRQRENLLKKVMEKRRLQELESINRNPKSYTSSNSVVEYISLLFISLFNLLYVGICFPKILFKVFPLFIDLYLLLRLLL